MKVEHDPVEFRPIRITLQTTNEVLEMKRMLQLWGSCSPGTANFADVLLSLMKSPKSS